MKIKKVLTVLKCITYAAVNITKFARKAFSHLIMSKNQPSSDNGASSKFSDLHEGVTMKALSRLVEKNIFFSATSIPTSCYFHSKFLLYLQFIYLPLRHAMLLPRSRITFIPPPRAPDLKRKSHSDCFFPMSYSRLVASLNTAILTSSSQVPSAFLIIFSSVHSKHFPPSLIFTTVTLYLEWLMSLYWMKISKKNSTNFGNSSSCL